MKSKENQDKRADYLQNLLLTLAGTMASSQVSGDGLDWRASFDSQGRLHLFQVLDEERKVVKRITEDDIDSYIRVQTIRDGEPMIRGQEASDLIKSFVKLVKLGRCDKANIIPMPRLIGDTEHQGYALCRLDYNLRKEAEEHFDTPARDLCPFLGDIADCFEEPSMWDMLKCWVGKMLLEDTSAPEVLIWFGSGGDGKTTFFQALREILGSNVSSVISQNTLADKWGMQLIVDNRLIVVEEADDSHKIWTSTLKLLTGNDTIKLEHKGKDPYIVENKSMIAMVTNAEPAIDKSSRAQLRRLRLLISKPVVRSKVRSQHEIAEEMKSVSRAFFGACVAAYLERGFVPVNSERVIDELSEDTLGPVMSFARQHFKYEEGTFTHNEVLRDILSAHGSRHSIKNLKTAIGNLDKKIETNARRYTGRGLKNVAPTNDGFHGFKLPYDEAKVVPDERANESLKDIWEGFAAK